MRGREASQSKDSPFAVLRPLNPGPYQLALPTQVLIGFIGWFRCATRGASIAGAMRNIRGTSGTQPNHEKSMSHSVFFVLHNPKKCSRKHHYVNCFLKEFVTHLIDSKHLSSERYVQDPQQVADWPLGQQNCRPTCTAEAPTAK